MKRYLFTLTVLISSALFLWTGFVTGNSFPEQPMMRLGEGTINQIAYSPDGKLLGAAGSIGAWLYDWENACCRQLITLKRTMLLQNFPNPFNPET